MGLHGGWCSLTESVCHKSVFANVCFPNEVGLYTTVALGIELE